MKLKLPVFALNTIDIGYRNQLIGAINAINQHCGSKNNAEDCLLSPLDINHYTEMKKSFCYTNYGNYKKFKSEVFLMLDDYMKKHPIPKIFITVYNPTESISPEKNVDMICKIIKEYYKQKNLGKIFTSVLTSRLHNYRYVDFINTPKHLLTFYSRIKLLKDKKLRKKTLITVGIIHKFSLKLVEEKKQELNNTLSNLVKNKVLQPQIDKLNKFIKSDKKIVICLGGRVAGNEIDFGINYAKQLLEHCHNLALNNYHIVIVNGPRTPNDVIDYLYNNIQKIPNVIFHNCKNIAQNEQERSSWRIYSGPNEEEFALHQQIGNIYPGILGYGNTLAVHTSESYSCCETACAGIPTAISSKGIFIDKNIRIDCINMKQLMIPKYVVDFDNFVDFACHMKIEPKHLKPTILSSSLKVFAEAITSRITS